MMVTHKLFKTFRYVPTQPRLPHPPSPPGHLMIPAAAKQQPVAPFCPKPPVGVQPIPIWRAEFLSNSTRPVRRL